MPREERGASVQLVRGGCADRARGGVYSIPAGARGSFLRKRLKRPSDLTMYTPHANPPYRSIRSLGVLLLECLLPPVLLQVVHLVQQSSFLPVSVVAPLPSPSLCDESHAMGSGPAARHSGVFGHDDRAIHYRRGEESAVLGRVGVKIALRTNQFMYSEPSKVP
jgi:hypothetical protein